MPAPSWVTQPLDARHRLDEFDCGEPALDRWLQRFALLNQRNDASKTRVVCDADDRVLGYYALAAGSVERSDAAARVAQGLARHPVPVIVLTRLEVDRSEQGGGVGRALLRDALLTVAEVSDTVGVRALLIHAKTDAAREWYLRHAEFESLPGTPGTLFLLIKDLRKAAGKA